MIYIIPYPEITFVPSSNLWRKKLGRQDTNRRPDNANQIKLLLSSGLMIQSASEHSENSHSRGDPCTEPVSETV